MFDRDKAREALNLISLLVKPSGELFDPEPWETEIIQDIFGNVDRSGDRIYTHGLIEIPKKNGKSTLGAALSLVAWLVDKEEAREVVLAATSADQAGRVFSMARQMVEKTPLIRPLVDIKAHTKVMLLRADPNNRLYAISADAGTADGIEPHFVLMDELHRHKWRDLYTVCRYGQAARNNTTMLSITTSGVSEETIGWEIHEYAKAVLSGALIDQNFYSKIWSLGLEEDWTSEENWKRVNPSLGSIKSLSAMREDFILAQRIPAQENQFRRFHLNQWVAQENIWFQLREWDKSAAELPDSVWRTEDVYTAFDLSATQDLTALVAVCEHEGVLGIKAWHWMCERTYNAKRLKDGRYMEWRKSGELTVTPGSAIEEEVIAEKLEALAERGYRLRELAYDPFNAARLSGRLDALGYTLVPVRQGFLSLSPPSKELERLVAVNALAHGGNSLLRWQASVVNREEDRHGNIRPVKPKRGRSEKRIDGIVALIMAVDRATRNRPSKKSVYASRGILQI